MNKLNLIIVGLTLSLSYGCVAPAKKPMYYWGNYSGTLYALKKNPNDESLNAHLKQLDDVILKSKEMDLKVPPGVYAEYGYWMLNAGKKEDAKKMFQTEKDFFPESAVLMDRMIKSIN